MKVEKRRSEQMRRQFGREEWQKQEEWNQQFVSEKEKVVKMHQELKILPTLLMLEKILVRYENGGKRGRVQTNTDH